MYCILCFVDWYHTISTTVLYSILLAVIILTDRWEATLSIRDLLSTNTGSVLWDHKVCATLNIDRFAHIFVSSTLTPNPQKLNSDPKPQYPNTSIPNTKHNPKHLGQNDNGDEPMCFMWWNCYLSSTWWVHWCITHITHLLHCFLILSRLHYSQGRLFRKIRLPSFT